MEALPDFLLPKAIEIFNCALKALLQRRSKNRSDTQSETQAHDSPDYIGVVMAALEASIIIKLGKNRETICAPMRQQAVKGESGRSHDGRPGCAEWSPQGASG